MGQPRCALASRWRSSQFDGAVEDLAEGLMAQISRDMPVLPVPLIAHLLLEDGGPVEMTALEIRLEKAMKRLPEGNIYLPRRRTSLRPCNNLSPCWRGGEW